MKPHLPITASLVALLMGSTVALAQEKGAQQEKGQPQIEQKSGGEKAAPPAAADKGMPSASDKDGSAPRAQSEPKDGAQSRTAQPGSKSGPADQDQQRGASKARTAEPQKGEPKAEPKRAEPKGGTDGKADGKARAEDQKAKGGNRNAEERTPPQDGKRQADQQKGDQKTEPGKAGKTRTGETKSGQPNGERDRFGYRPDESKTGQPKAGDTKTGEPASRPDAAGKAANAPSGGERNVVNEPAARVQVTTEQRTRIRQAIDVRKTQKVRRVDFNISIGTPVPRHVRFRPMPATIVTIVPEYRGYDYFVVDERICIVQPRTRVIVAVIEERDTGGPAQTSSLMLTPDERTIILRTVDRERDRANLSISLTRGVDIPAGVELHVFPDRIVEEVPKLRAYRYVVVDREVVLVDPSSRSVALIVEP